MSSLLGVNSWSSVRCHCELLACGGGGCGAGRRCYEAECLLLEEPLEDQLQGLVTLLQLVLHGTHQLLLSSRVYSSCDCTRPDVREIAQGGLRARNMEQDHEGVRTCQHSPVGTVISAQMFD